MASVADLVEGAAILRLADPVDYDAGQQLSRRGAVVIEVLSPPRVTATVNDDAGHRVELRSTARGLEWWCGCSSGRSGVFCRHVVATALETWHRSPPRRGEPAS
jgi:uncharacterized Zn finger protein